MGQLERDKNTPPTPWIAILTSVPMMALVCAQVRISKTLWDDNIQDF